MSGIRIRYLSFFFGLISILSLLNVAFSYQLNLYLNLNTYYLSFISSIIIGVIFYYFEKVKSKITIFDKILTVFFGYLVLPIILCLPFYFSIYDLTFLNAYFESVSGFTSTGFTTFENIKYIDQSLILWRSTIQWVGGLYFLFSIIYLIDIYDENLKKSLTNYLSFSSSEVFKQSFKIFFLYSGLTLFIFIVLNFLSVRYFNSLNLAFTIISSGGFLPTNNLSDILKNDTQIVIFSLLLLFSYFSIFFFYNLFFIRKKNINFFYEDVHLIFYYLIIVSIFFIFFSYQNDFSKNLIINFKQHV
jgi:trk system potassium uptake protein TrkH